MTDDGFVTRKSLAALLDCSSSTIKRYEDRWRLVRLRGWKRPIRYDRTATLRRLKVAGLL